MKHITFNEWLPIIIGRAKMQELGLLPLQQGSSQDYDKETQSVHFERICCSRFPVRPHPHPRETSVRFIFLLLFNYEPDESNVCAV
jgi:hypothetical protein